MAFSWSPIPGGKAGHGGGEKVHSPPRGGKWTQAEYCLAVAGLCTLIGTIIVAWKYDKFESILKIWQESEHESEIQGRSSNHLVNITIVKSAVAKGAVCLDGSPPAYFWDRGSGTGIDNWIVFLEGGGWCPSDETCLDRAFTDLGSSLHMPPKMRMKGILSGSRDVNPDFYNWNRVKVKYCDAGSFSGDVEDPKKNHSPFKLYYRGQRIWKAVMDDLLEKGMKNARKAFLGGCSAGGLASILHCDQYRDLMPQETSVKCLSDAGFFVNAPDVGGVHTIEAFFERVVTLQNMVGNLPKACNSPDNEMQCIFPQYFIGTIQTPLFVLNPAYDSWQFENVLVPFSADPQGEWSQCKKSLSYCSETQLQAVQDFRLQLLKGLEPLLKNEKDAAFIDSCYLHCQSESDSTWSGELGPRIDNKSIAQIVGDWYMERNTSKVIDGPYPSNPTCLQYQY